MNTEFAIPQNFTYFVLLTTAFFLAHWLGLPKILEIIIPVIMMLVAGLLAIIDLQNISREKKVVMLSNNPEKQLKALTVLNNELRSKKVYTVFYILIFFVFCQNLVMTLLIR